MTERKADIEAIKERWTRDISTSWNPTQVAKQAFADIPALIADLGAAEAELEGSRHMGRNFFDTIGKQTEKIEALEAEVTRLKELIKKLVSRDAHGQWIFTGLRIDHPELTEARQPVPKAREALDELHEAQAALEEP